MQVCHILECKYVFTYYHSLPVESILRIVGEISETKNRIISQSV